MSEGDLIGVGNPVSGGEAEGRLQPVDEIDQVFALLGSDGVGEAIIVTESASATVVAPLLTRVRGVVCRSGGPTSHLAIITREFGLPCLMAAELPPTEEIEGVWAAISDGGELRRA